MKRLASAFIAALATLALATPAAAAELAKTAFGRVTSPSGGAPLAIGSYARGCLAGAAELAEAGPRFQAMRLSRNRRFGHPALIGFVEELAADAPRMGLGGILVGDLGQPRGGPLPFGHTSHQIGLDVDVWFIEMPDPPLSAEARETLPFVSVLAGKGGAADPSRLTEPFMRLLRRAAQDPATARVFVHPEIKKALCGWPRAGTGIGREWLAKIRPWYGHDAHFHVRLACPDGSPECENQTPPPAGDGCGAPLAYWFTDAPYRPKKGAKPRPPLTVASLPPACGALLETSD